MRYNGIICIFGPKKDHFRQTATYRKTEGVQSYLRIWGCCDMELREHNNWLDQSYVEDRPR